MTDGEERIFYERRAKADLAPGNVASHPSARFRWSRYIVAAAAVLAVVFGGWWLFIRPSSPVASSVEEISMTGDSNSEGPLSPGEAERATEWARSLALEA